MNPTRNEKILLWLMVGLYWVWPLDVMPGLPFDDIALVAGAWQYQDEIIVQTKAFVKQLIKEKNER